MIGMSLEQIIEKIKGQKGGVVIRWAGFIIYLIAVCVLLWGIFIQIKVIEQVFGNAELKILDGNFDVLDMGQASAVISGKYIASKSGKKYYPVGCKSANRIKPENRVFFESQEEALRLGLELSSTCSE
jgi:hypothetical protein